MKPLCIASNMLNEIDQVEEWYDNMVSITDYILIVDTGSTDGTKEFFEGKDCVFITYDIIRREGYGPARNHLREMARLHFPECHWLLYLDADERIMPDDFFNLRCIKDYLIDSYDVVALPRLNRLSKDTMETKVDYHIHPDYQSRMTRLYSDIKYVRKLHEQITGYQKIYAELTNPKIHHFHRTTSKKKRDEIGKLCQYLHSKDDDYGHTYPQHHKSEYYKELLQKEGL